VTSRYFTSVFMNSCSAVNLLGGLDKAMPPERVPGIMNKVLQFSMDGPHVNFKFLKLFNESIAQTKTLLSCSISVSVVCMW